MTTIDLILIIVFLIIIMSMCARVIQVTFEEMNQKGVTLPLKYKGELK